MRTFASMLLVLVAASAAAATNVSGNVTGTWTAAGSPYRVTGNISVPAGRMLTVQAGVQVLFDADAKWDVAGELVVRGSVQDSVTIAKGTATNWKGIRILAGGAASISCASVSHARKTAYVSGDPDSQGGAFYIGTGAKLRLYRVVVNRATTGAGGGAIYVTGGSLALSYALIRDAEVTGGGGWGKGAGIYAVNATIAIDHSRITRCRAGYNGIGMNIIANSVVTISDSRIDHNTGTTYGFGGGIFINASRLVLTNTRVEYNELLTSAAESWAQATGCGINASSADLEITGSSISYNTNANAVKGGGGGGMAISSSRLVMRNTVVYGNTATRSGGGITFGGVWPTAPLAENVTIEDCLIAGNTVLGAPGAPAYYNLPGAVDIIHRSGGGINFADSLTATVRRTVIVRNRAEKFGGGLCFSSSPAKPGCLKPSATATFVQCTIADNHALQPSSYMAPVFYGGSEIRTWKLGPQPLTFNSCIIRGAYEHGPTEYSTGFHGQAAMTFSRCIMNPTVSSDSLYIYGGPYAVGGTNQDADPLFVARSGGNYRLAATSRGVDAGDPALPLDADGSPADIGALSTSSSAADRRKATWLRVP